ncbi:hypothetical protein IWQ60_010289 [Tieghemiomyces parasiticus]|uniref:Uncharacterized protein n=1 Tax=Tieghemiomyces parasiticus TaxID=78921 RepID=A0A9W7ZRW7_9FUNG|nr:hypothetical protein IWQ60_010289 [Tieghemiomyces parasiticus]
MLPLLHYLPFMMAASASAGLLDGLSPGGQPNLTQLFGIHPENILKIYQLLDLMKMPAVNMGNGAPATDGANRSPAPLIAPITLPEANVGIPAAVPMNPGVPAPVPAAVPMNPGTFAPAPAAMPMNPGTFVSAPAPVPMNPGVPAPAPAAVPMNPGTFASAPAAVPMAPAVPAPAPAAVPMTPGVSAPVTQAQQAPRIPAPATGPPRAPVMANGDSLTGTRSASADSNEMPQPPSMAKGAASNPLDAVMPAKAAVGPTTPNMGAMSGMDGMNPMEMEAMVFGSSTSSGAAAPTTVPSSSGPMSWATRSQSNSNSSTRTVVHKATHSSGLNDDDSDMSTASVFGVSHALLASAFTLAVALSAL